MANEQRARFNFVSGTLSSSLTNVATSMSSAGLANLGVIDSTNYAAIAIENEIVWVTAHTGGATTATIVRGQEGTTGAAHSSAVAWQHGPTAFDLGTDWTPYTPTLTQSATVTKTVTYARYQRVGRLITGSVILVVTGAGTAANAVAIGLPVASTPVVGNIPLGIGWIFDTSAGDTIVGEAYLATTTTAQLVSTRSPGSIVGTGGGFAAALASGDQITLRFDYESAT